MKLRWPRKLTPYLFILPALAIYGVFVLYPVIQTFMMSLWKWDGQSPDFEWVGLSNYAKVLTSSSVWTALSHNAIWVLMAAFPIIIGLGLAVALQQHKPAGRGIYRTLYFLPYVLPPVVAAFVWNWVYHPNWGALNSMLGSVGLGGLAQNWIGNPDIALFALATTANWSGYGFCMVLFLSGLNAIDPTLYDAAKLDGANKRQEFRNVTLPGIANTTNVVVLIVFINTVRVFDIVWVMTAGGPNGSTEVLGTLIYRETFQNLNVGYGSAIAMFMVFIILFCTVFYLRAQEKDD